VSGGLTTPEDVASVDVAAAAYDVAFAADFAPQRKRSITLQGHRTSVSLEEGFWRLLKKYAEGDGLSVPALVSEVDRRRPPETGLSGALRLYVLARLTSG